MIITEKKRIKIDHECKDFPIYLTWLNSLGGYSYWLFFKSHDEVDSTKLDTPYIFNIDDLETAIGTNDIIGKSTNQSLNIGARISSVDMDGMRGLNSSPKVLMLTNPETWETEGAVWKRVIIKPKSFLALKTKQSFFNIKMSLSLPNFNTQTE